ncbi:hypothetical protein AO371_1445 [Moraxella catarrhalis]|nr:hypothetical protein AO371_1445 [Moraxella catarrhalis]
MLLLSNFTFTQIIFETNRLLSDAKRCAIAFLQPILVS